MPAAIMPRLADKDATACMTKKPTLFDVDTPGFALP
jgi:hypothetical protein